jgi:HlyD family secretion protein
MIDAKADLDEKKLDNERAQKLFAKDEISAQERDLAATALKRAEAIFKAAGQRYNEAVEGSRKEDIDIARANLNEASADLGLSRVNLSYSVLRAPSAGVVTVRQAEIGEVVSPGSPVITLSDLDHIWLRAYIAETDLGRIHWGQDATITTDTYPGKQYRGRISFISSTAEFTPKSVQNNHGARHAGLPHQDRHRQLQSRTQTRNARRRAHRSGGSQAMTNSAPIRDCGRGIDEEFSRCARG